MNIQEILHEMNIEWKPCEEGQLFYPGMVAIDNEGYVYIIGHAVSNEDGKEIVYDDGCGCCSTAYSSYSTASVKFVQYGWLIHNKQFEANERDL